MLIEEVTLLEEAERFQVMGFKHKKIATRDEKEQQLFNKAKGRQQGKYCRNATVKMGSANPCERYISIRQDCLVHYIR